MRGVGLGYVNCINYVRGMAPCFPDVGGYSLSGRRPAEVVENNRHCVILIAIRTIELLNLSF